MNCAIGTPHHWHQEPGSVDGLYHGWCVNLGADGQPCGATRTWPTVPEVIIRRGGGRHIGGPRIIPPPVRRIEDNPLGRFHYHG